MAANRRFFDALAIGLVLVLTASTAYIHYWVGGMMLMLNALGYAGLAALVVGSFVFYRRALPLVLGMLAVYAAVTIAGWLVMGPYFPVAYLAKAIEIALIATIAVWLRMHASETRAALQWARSLIPGRGGSPAR
jgi:hypothetical protein